MAVLLTLFYILFTICVVYPPTEIVTAGFTIPQLLDGCLGSENMNFVEYHMRRISLTVLIHSALPLGYFSCLWCSGVENLPLIWLSFFSLLIPLITSVELCSWWEGTRTKHPVAKALMPFVTQGSDWRVVASNINVDFRGVDKVVIPLSGTSRLVATEIWLIKVSQYSVNVVKQSECSVVALSTDTHNLAITGQDETQFINLEVIPILENRPGFKFRIGSAALSDLQPRLGRPVVWPDHLSLLPTMIERFVEVFKFHVDQNPPYFVDQEPELCIGCMTAPSDVKLVLRCEPRQVAPGDNAPLPCKECYCRVLWCCACLARWWAARARSPPDAWLGARGSCPVCRAVFCLADVSPVRPAPPGFAATH